MQVRDVEVVRDDRGVLGVLRVAVARHEDAQGVVREGGLGERRDDGGVDAAGEAEDRAGAAGRGDLGGDPVREMSGEFFHASLSEGESIVRDGGPGGAAPARPAVAIPGAGREPVAAPSLRRSLAAGAPR